MTFGGKKELIARPGAVLAATAALAIGLPSAVFALPGISPISSFAHIPVEDITLDHFTPASVDPELARRVAAQLKALGAPARFTPARYTPVSVGKSEQKTVTVAIRVDDRTALAISRRPANGSVGKKPAIKQVAASIASTHYDLGAARGYQGFAKPVSSLPAGLNDNKPLPANIDFQLADVKKKKGKPSRFRPRVALEKEARPGRAPRTIQGAGDQSLDLGGSYRVTRNLDVTAGVRLSQERDRLDPVTNNVQDNQAVYVGTQLRF